MVVRTKVDLDVKSQLSFNPEESKEEIVEMIRNSTMSFIAFNPIWNLLNLGIKIQVGARLKQIFLCAAVAPYFDTSKLCQAMIEFFVKFKFPHVDEDELEKMEENCSKGMTDAIMMKRFNLTPCQIQCFRNVLELKVI